MLLTLHFRTTWLLDCDSSQAYVCIFCAVDVAELKQKVKQSQYTPWRRLGGEEV
jgi:hypothetical protein